MHVDAYMLCMLFGPMIGMILALAALPVAIYGLFARKPGRGWRAAKIALWLSGAAAAASFLLWYVLATGHDRRGGSLDYADGSFEVFRFIARLEAVALGLSALCALRQRLRRAPR